MGGEAKILAVAPENFGFVLEIIFGEDVMEVDDLVPGAIADQDKHGPLMTFDIVLDEGLYPAIDLLLHLIVEII